MSSVPENNRFAPPTAHVEAVATDTQELGGRGARLAAVLIDGLIQGALYWALAATIFTGLLTPPAGAGLFGLLARQLLAGFVLFALLQGYLLATQGQTIGKKLLGLRIVRSNGERASLARLLGLRTFLGWALVMVPFAGAIYALVDSLLIFRESHKCLHDNIADTIVVRA